MGNGNILAILAGGRSSRFAGGKVNLRVCDQPILTWLHGRLGAGFDEAWLNLSPDQPIPPGAELYQRVVRDEQAHAGPLLGIARLLEAAPPEARLLIVPVDMPLLRSSDAQRLLDGLEGLDTAAVMARWQAGPQANRVEPLPSAWQASRGAALVQASLEAGARGPSALADDPAVRCIRLNESDDAQAWHSVNTRDDLAPLRAAGLVVDEP